MTTAVNKSVICVLCVLLGFAFCENSDNPVVHCDTTKGPLSIEVHRDWAPLGANRFLELINDDFFTDIAFYRCVNRFLTQFGISDHSDKKHWHRQQIKDDPNLNLGIKKNYVSFAGGGPNTRSTQIFIAFEDLDFLGHEPWETPFGVVVEGQSTLDNLYKEYGDIPPFGEGPDQQEIFKQGNGYVRQFYPEVDFIHSCAVVSNADLLDQLPIASGEATDNKNQFDDQVGLADPDAAALEMQQEADTLSQQGTNKRMAGDDISGNAKELSPEDIRAQSESTDSEMKNLLRRGDGNKFYSAGKPKRNPGTNNNILENYPSSNSAFGLLDRRKEMEVIMVVKALCFLGLLLALIFFYWRYGRNLGSGPGKSQ